MWAFAKALLLVGRYFRRIAVALESIRELYELDLSSRGVYRTRTPTKDDEVDIMYGAKQSADIQDEWR